MNYSYQKSDPLLSSYIQTVLVVSDGSEAPPSDLPLVTSGMPALLYLNSGLEQHEITLFGQSIPDDKWNVTDSHTTIAVFFKPFALGTMFKISAKELKEKPVELQRWNPQKSMALNLQLIHSKSVQEKVDIVNHFLVTQFQANQRECEIVQFATDRMMENQETNVLSEILKDLNLTQRTFQRTFKHYVGISPNQYRRICQFYFAFSQLKGKHFDKQSDVAYNNNYFDQSHYIRSFKEFTDITPNDYLQFGLIKKDK